MFNKFLLTATCLVSLLITTSVYALRIQRPLVLTYPLTQDQVSQLNKFLEEIWLLQQGRFELDIVTTTKSNAKNGEIWIFNDGGTYKLAFKAGGAVRTITP
jgi:anti-sigma-K factor RskA